MRRKKPSRFERYDESVFINCPFDNLYKPLFQGIVFTVIFCGLRARCAQEIDDASQVRIDKIFMIVEECRFGIHDLSRTQLDEKSRLPRFNMPLELGMFLGVKRMGNNLQRRKVCLILDQDPYRYQKFISDIAGQDIRSHSRKSKNAISVTRDWLRSQMNRQLPGGAEIWTKYTKFRREFPTLCGELRIRAKEVTFNDYTNIVTEWLKAELSHSP